ncbi:MAG: hypothetical protein JWM90_2532 [Thermoleophilia bacterium]|nr:hypothetical protein [Thermoleophilia bacterium]
MSNMRSEERMLHAEQQLRSVPDDTVAPLLARWSRPWIDERDAEDMVKVACECAQMHCVDEVRLPAGLHELHRYAADRFVVQPGHTVAAGTEVIVESEGYWIVQLLGVGTEELACDGENEERTADDLVDMLRRAIDHRERSRSQQAEVRTHLLALRRRSEEARSAAHHYSRAVHRYRNLMRHRIANPLATISGMAETLRHVDGIDRERSCQLLDAIIQEARGLARISIDPRSMSPEEIVLEPWPGIDVPVVPDLGGEGHA